MPDGFVLDESHSEEKDPWAAFRTITDNKGICNPKASENFAVQSDVKAWRTEFRSNCWWLAHDSASKHYIRTFDWGTAPKFLIDGLRGPPSVEVWVMGMHENEKSVPYRRSLTLYRIKCLVAGASRQAPVQFIAYDRNDKIIEQWERAKSEPKAPLPGSKEEAFAWAVCN